MSDTDDVEEEWSCPRCTLVNPASNLACVACGTVYPASESPLRHTAPTERQARSRPRSDSSGAWPRAMGFLGAVAGSAAGAILSSTRRGTRPSEHAVWMAFGAAMGIEVVQLVRHITARTGRSRGPPPHRRSRQIRRRDPASFEDYLRGDRDDVPWVQRDPSEAYQILVAARQGRSPQRSVERLALLQLLIQLHRESHERTGDPVAALGAAMAQQQFHAVLDGMSYEEMYEYFGGGSLSNILCAGPAAAEGVSDEAMRHLPSATVRVLEGLPSIDGKKVTSCSICLEDFGKGQRVRELPRCRHVFHAHCVDRWLRMHNACPLCRIAAL